MKTGNEGEQAKGTSKRNKQREKSAKIALFVPSEEWPVAIIIQLVQHMKESGPFERVILGSGFHSDGA